MFTSNGNYIKPYDSKREVERDGYERFRSGDELEPQLSKGHWLVISNETPKNKSIKNKIIAIINNGKLQEKG